MDTDWCAIHAPRFTIEGRSRAGHESWFRIRELGVALDIGRGPDAIIAMPTVLVSHAHLDHAAGIPFYAGQRRLQRMPGGRVVVPSEAADDFRALMALHSKLEGTDYDIEIVGMAPGDTLRLSKTLEVRAHRATHRVPARGWELVEIRHHLKPEYAGLGREAIAALAHEGLGVSEEYRHSVLFYTGDTDRGLLEENDALYKAEVLMIECSFVAEADLERAAMYRHIHFDDIAEFADRFENELIVLTHFSRRYGNGEIRDMLRRRCPASLRDRIRMALPQQTL